MKCLLVAGHSSLYLTRRRCCHYTWLFLHFSYTQRIHTSSAFVISSCVVIGCPTLQTKMSQSPGKCSIVNRPIFAEWRTSVWCTRLAFHHIGCLKLIALELNTFNDPCILSVPPRPLPSLCSSRPSGMRDFQTVRGSGSGRMVETSREPIAHRNKYEALQSP